jgi:hypothetical protein
MPSTFEQNIILAPVCFVEDLTMEGARDFYCCHSCGKEVREVSVCCDCGLVSCQDCLTVCNGVSLCKGCLEHQEHTKRFR